jgi:hypothetical protein
MSTLIPSLLTLLGAIVGASLQFFTSRRIAREGKYLYSLAGCGDGASDEARVDLHYMVAD